MNIIITVHTYWPDKDGVQYVTQYLAEGLAQKGHEVSVIVSVKSKDAIGQDLHNGVKIYRVFLKAKWSLFVFGKKQYLNMLIPASKSADVLINCCVQSPINNVLLPYLKRIKCKKVLYMHGIHGFQYKQNELRYFKYFAWHCFMNIRWSVFYKLNAKNFNCYDLMIDIHESSEAFRYFDGLKIDTRRVIIHNAVESFDGEYIQNLKVEDGKYFLCVANYNKQKNQKMLLDVFEKIEDIDYKLVLIGKSSDYSAGLREYINVKNLNDRVLLLENLDRELTKAYIKHCYCAVLSSQREIYPIFLCESLRCGHPYISTNVGCIRDIPGGFIAETVDEFVNKIKFAINNPEEMRNLGVKGKEYADANYSQEEKVDELEEELFSLVR